jgi:hypothetical protein
LTDPLVAGMTIFAITLGPTRFLAADPRWLEEPDLEAPLIRIDKRRDGSERLVPNGNV